MLAPTTALWLILSVQTPAAAPKIGGIESITSARLRAHLNFIAADAMEGRETPSRGLDATANYIAAQMALWGVKPAGENGSYFQRFEVAVKSPVREDSFLDIDGLRLKMGPDFMPTFQRASGQIEGPMVFVGNGWIIEKRGINPYKDLDVKGKILIACGQPAITPEDGRAGTDIFPPMQAAARLGAAGVIFVMDDRAAPNYNFFKSNFILSPSVKPYESAKDLEITIGMPSVLLSPAGARKLFEGQPMSAAEIATLGAKGDAMTPFELGKTAKLRVTFKAERAWTQNVVAKIEGSDPKLKAEYVALGAHYDHIGMDPDNPGDQIFNGADDDGTGISALLEIAHSYARGPRPKRSILLVWHAGEEKGLIGSKYYVEKPTVNLKQIVAMLNVDMIGRSRLPSDTQWVGKLNARDELFLVGSTMMSTDLQKLSEATNASLYKWKLDYRFDDPKDPQQVFFRSDHYHYATKGIPIIFYTTGEHPNYHQLSDEVSTIDFRKFTEVTKFIYATSWNLAMTPNRPKVDKKIPGS